MVVGLSGQPSPLSKGLYWLHVQQPTSGASESSGAPGLFQTAERPGISSVSQPAALNRSGLTSSNHSPSLPGSGAGIRPGGSLSLRDSSRGRWGCTLRGQGTPTFASRGTSHTGSKRWASWPGTSPPTSFHGCWAGLPVWPLATPALAFKPQRPLSP